jgi:enoyl-CoA hydratase/carnithine racemase
MASLLRLTRVFCSSHLIAARRTVMTSCVSVEYRVPVALIKMDNNENRFTPQFFVEFLRALDEIESNDNVKALITTGSGKFYSNGLDLDGMASSTPEHAKQVNINVGILYKRMLSYPMVTIAAINGHAFAAGGLLALSHDYRIMKKERGWFCLPEVNINIPFTKPLMELAKGRLPQKEHTDCILFGKRYTADEGQLAGIIHTAVLGDELLSTSIKLAEDIAKEDIDRHTLAAMKTGLNYDIIKEFSVPSLVTSIAKL